MHTPPADLAIARQSAPSGFNFANLYYSVRAGAGPVGVTGASIGFEVGNDRAFFPGGARVCCSMQS